MATDSKTHSKQSGKTSQASKHHKIPTINWSKTKIFSFNQHLRIVKSISQLTTKKKLLGQEITVSIWTIQNPKCSTSHQSQTISLER